jgi:tetratricopeptide (TPR) repeat protein
VVLIAAGGYWYYHRSAPPPPPAPPEVPAEQGVDPRVVAAITQARQEVAAQPTSGTAWGELGKLFFAHDFEAQSESCFAEAERLNSADDRWPYYRALIALGHDLEQGLPHLRRAAAAEHASDAYRSAARLRLAEALLERQELDEAEQLFREELDADPRSARAAYGLGLAAVARGDLDAAARHLTAAAGTPLARRKASAQLASIARRRGDPAAAERYEQEATRPPADVNWPDPFVADLNRMRAGQQVLLQQADALERRGLVAEAAKVLEQMAREYPNERTYLALGATLIKLGDYPRAEQVLRTCLRLDPDRPMANHYLAVALFLQAEKFWPQPAERERARGLFRDAADAARRAVAHKPDDAIAYVFLGRSLNYLGEREAALASLRKAVECRPEVPDSHLYLGEALADAGRPDDARAEYRTAEQLAGPDDPRPRQALERLGKRGP